MIIYIIIKILLSIWLIINKRIKEIWKVSLGLDIIILLSFLYLLVWQEIQIITGILFYSLIIIGIFLFYRSMNYILQNEISFIIKIIENEKVKKILLNPKVAKSIYYFIWMLPWNIGYWIYFWIQENGWYVRVWISSTRDIVLWKLFKWDSRDYFYNLFEKINKSNKIIKIKEKKDKIIKVIYRILYILFYIKKEMLITKISMYIWMRMIIYMYLTIFYFYVFEEIQIFNKYLFYGLIFIEVIILYKMEEIINYFEKEIIEAFKINKIYNENFVTHLNIFKNPFHWNVHLKWDWHVTFWDIILCHSVSLNILYKYILYVNKNTKGYFDKQMNISTRDNKLRLMGVQWETDSIIWSVLPRTRYVIINLKGYAYETQFNISYNNYFMMAQNKINLNRNKNLYLSYYEKTYSKTSLLMLIWILRVNNSYWDLWWNDLNKEYINYSQDSSFAYNTIIHSVYNKIFLLLYSLYILKNDKRLIKDLKMIIIFFFGKQKYYFNEETYFFSKEYGLEQLIKNGNKLVIPEKICGLGIYIKMFKIMSRIMWREEETVNWNSYLFENLNNFKKTCSYILYKPKGKIENLNLFTKEEKEFYECLINKIEILQGSIIYPSFILDHDFFKDSEVRFLSHYVQFKNKEYNWLFKEFDNLLNNDGHIDFNKLEIDEENTILNNIELTSSDDYLNMLYIFLISQQIFYEQHIFRTKEECIQLGISLTEIFNCMEKWKEYKDYNKYFS